MIIANVIFIHLLGIAIVKAEVTVTCRGVLFDSTNEADSQPVWPLDTCINTDDNSMIFYCDEQNNYAVQVQNWNATDCDDGSGTGNGWEDPGTNILSDGCMLTNPCAVAVVNEYINTDDSCVNNDPNQMHLPDVTVAIDQCWYDNLQNSYMKLTCTDNDKNNGFGFDITVTKYTDDKCTIPSGTPDTIDGTASNCFNPNTMTNSPYFENVQCKFPTPVFETDCRSVSENNNIVWPLDECVGTEIWTDAAYELSSSRYYCEMVGNNWAVRQQRWDGNMNCEGDGTVRIPTNINANGCNRGKICNFARIDEYLFSKDGNDDCIAGGNQQGANNRHITVPIVTDTCVNQDGSFFKVSCTSSDSTSFDKLTYQEYADSGCLTATTMEQNNGEAGCLDISLYSPYFADVECVSRSAVYETECRSVSQNNNIVWAIDECISTSAYANTQTTMSSQIYKCDANDMLYVEQYDVEDCVGDPVQTVNVAVGINAHGCSRSKPCDLIRFDEYLNSKGLNGNDACAKNEQDANNMHIKAATVEGVCSLNERGEYIKLTCAEDANAAFGFTVTYQVFAEEGCNGAVTTSTVSEEGCLAIPESPYFISMSCNFTSPVYETNCRSVSQNNNAVWPLDKCFSYDQKTDKKASKYVCNNNEIMREDYMNQDNCDGDPTQTVRPDDINAYNCDSLVDCPIASFDEYLNSETDGNCALLDDVNADDYFRIQGDIVLNVCAKNHHGGYFKVRCEENPSAGANDFAYKLIYENYTDVEGCVANDANGIPIVDVIEYPDCLDAIPESPWFASLVCQGAETVTVPSQSPTEVPISVDTGADANAIKSNSLLLWMIIFVSVYWISK